LISSHALTNRWFQSCSWCKVVLCNISTIFGCAIVSIICPGAITVGVWLTCLRQQSWKCVPASSEPAVGIN
jgi:hypothetical protein